MGPKKSYDRSTAIGLGIFLVILSLAVLGVGTWGFLDYNIYGRRYGSYYHGALWFTPIHCMYTGGLWLIAGCLAIAAGATKSLPCIQASLAFQILSCLCAIALAILPITGLTHSRGYNCYSQGYSHGHSDGRYCERTGYNCYSYPPYYNDYYCQDYYNNSYYYRWTIWAFIYTCVSLGILGGFINVALASICNKAACGCGGDDDDSDNRPNRVAPMPMQQPWFTPNQMPMVAMMPAGNIQPGAMPGQYPTQMLPALQPSNPE